MNEIGCYLKKIQLQLEAGFNNAYRKYGITRTQFDILIFLGRQEGNANTLTDIASHFGVRHTSMLHVLKRLEEKGYIKKSGGGSRSKPITLTDSGWQLLSVVESKDAALHEIMFAGIPEGSRQLLGNMLRQIYENLDSDAFRNL